MTIRTPSNAFLIQRDEQLRHEHASGVVTTLLVTPDIAITSFITGYSHFPAGAEVPFHTHDTPESVVLLEGCATLEIDGFEYELKPHDGTFIPPNVSHRFRNPSKTEPMTVLWILACSPKRA